jgi:hypothetical protein
LRVVFGWNDGDRRDQVLSGEEQLCLTDVVRSDVPRSDAVERFADVGPGSVRRR